MHYLQLCAHTTTSPSRKKFGLKQTWAQNCMYVGIARPDNLEFMLAAEDLKISNAKGILRTTLRTSHTVAAVATQSKPALWMEQVQNKGVTRGFLLSMEGTNENCFLSNSVANSSRLTVDLLVAHLHFPPRKVCYCRIQKLQKDLPLTPCCSSSFAG